MFKDLLNHPTAFLNYPMCNRTNQRDMEEETTGGHSKCYKIAAPLIITYLRFLLSPPAIFELGGHIILSLLHVLEHICKDRLLDDILQHHRFWLLLHGGLFVSVHPGLTVVEVLFSLRLFSFSWLRKSRRIHALFQTHKSIHISYWFGWWWLNWDGIEDFIQILLTLIVWHGDQHRPVWSHCLNRFWLLRSGRPGCGVDHCLFLNSRGSYKRRCYSFDFFFPWRSHCIHGWWFRRRCRWWCWGWGSSQRRRCTLASLHLTIIEVPRSRRISRRSRWSTSWWWSTPTASGLRSPRWRAIRRGRGPRRMTAPGVGTGLTPSRRRTPILRSRRAPGGCRTTPRMVSAPVGRVRPACLICIGWRIRSRLIL